MKKNYFTILISIISILSFSQNVIITSIVEGDCPGSITPRVVELYVNGTVDVTNLRLQMQFDNNTTDTWTLNTAIGAGSYTNQFLYVEETNAVFNTEFPGVSTPSTLTVATLVNFLRGGDKLRLIDTSNGNSVIDQYGVTNTDGAGTNWEYTNSYVKRKANNGPNPVFTESEWEIFPVGSLSGLGTCNGGANLNQTVQLQSYTTTLSVNQFSLEKNDFNIYPNPVDDNGILFIKDSSNLDFLIIYDITGAKIKEVQFKNAKEINLSELSSGVYFIKGFSLNSEIIGVKKIIKN